MWSLKNWSAYLTGQKNIETEDARYFDLNHLPELSRGRTTETLIELCYEASQDNAFIPIID